MTTAIVSKDSYDGDVGLPTGPGCVNKGNRASRQLTMSHSVRRDRRSNGRESWGLAKDT